MIKKLIIAILVTSPLLFAKTFNIEALYGFGFVNIPASQKITGNAHDGGIRAIFYTDNFTHEVLGRTTFASDIKVKNNSSLTAKYSMWEAEYRFGSRIDNDMAKFGMLSGSAYLGVGYQSFVTNISNIKTTTNFIYLPFGFWGEDESGLANLKIRYGLNLRAIFFDDSTGKFKYDFLFGGKIYAGVGYSLGMFDVFGQLFFTYNAPLKNIKMYGIEAGIQF